MRRRSQILMFLLLVVSGFCAYSVVTFAHSDDFTVVTSPASHHSASFVTQVGLVELEQPTNLIAEESFDSMTGKIPLACSNSARELAVANSLFSVLLDCHRGGGQSLVNRHVRLQI
jgi:hypothetical protein